MNGNKKITWVLMVSLIAIWGSIAYQLVEAVGKPDNEEVETSHPNEALSPSKEKFTFESNIRDPFRYVARNESPRKSALVQQSAQWVPPPFRLTGIIVNDKERMAVLEGPDGATYFVSEGETLNGVRLLKILERKVTYKYLDETKDWALAQ